MGRNENEEREKEEEEEESLFGPDTRRAERMLNTKKSRVLREAKNIKVLLIVGPREAPFVV